jgi:hypothetical protein
LVESCSLGGGGAWALSLESNRAADVHKWARDVLVPDPWALDLVSEKSF